MPPLILLMVNRPFVAAAVGIGGSNSKGCCAARVFHGLGAGKRTATSIPDGNGIGTGRQVSELGRCLESTSVNAVGIGLRTPGYAVIVIVPLLEHKQPAWRLRLRVL